MYAHVTDGVVDQVGGLPRLVFDGGRWWDLRTKDPALLASLGWYEVTLTDRPADTDTTTFDLAYEFADGAVTQVWTERAKTPEELEAEVEDANRRTIEEAISQDLDAMQAIIAQTNADLRADPAQEIKDIARAIRRIDRMILGRFENTA